MLSGSLLSTLTPFGAKKARQGTLQSEDVGVAVRRCVKADAESKTVVVGSTPINIQTSAIRDLGLASVAMVLTPKALPLAAQQFMRCWDVASEVILSLRESTDIAAAAPFLPLLLHNISAVEGYSSLDTISAEELEVLTATEAHDIAMSESKGDSKVWHLTEKGRALLQAGVRLSNPSLVLAPRSLPGAELTLYDLIITLGRAGWEFREVRSQKQLREVKAKPYKHGSADKVWWLPGSPCLKPYLFDVACHCCRPRR
jgi:hypothetical protein